MQIVCLLKYAQISNFPLCEKISELKKRKAMCIALKPGNAIKGLSKIYPFLTHQKKPPAIPNYNRNQRPLISAIFARPNH